TRWNAGVYCGRSRRTHRTVETFIRCYGEEDLPDGRNRQRTGDQTRHESPDRDDLRGIRLGADSGDQARGRFAAVAVADRGHDGAVRSRRIQGAIRTATRLHAEFPATVDAQ